MNDSVQDNLERIDQEKLVDAAKKEAVSEVEKLKQELVQSIQGEKKKYSWEEKGKTKPDNYDELFEEVDKRVVKPEDLEKLVENKLSETEKKRQEAEEQSRKQKELELGERKKQFDSEWYDLVQQGKMPKVADEIQERINKNEKLTKDEILADEGLKARLELAQLSQSTGKTAKVAYYEDYTAEAAGKSAPVLGGRPSTPQTDSQELEYEDVAQNRKNIFGY